MKQAAALVERTPYTPEAAVVVMAGPVELVAFLRIPDGQLTAESLAGPRR